MKTLFRNRYLSCYITDVYDDNGRLIVFSIELNTKYRYISITLLNKEIEIEW
jgi:hypothetical protein